MIYDYVCSCGKEKELVCQIGTAPITIKCECKELMYKKVTVPTFQLKGEGWTRTKNI